MSEAIASKLDRAALLIMLRYILDRLEPLGISPCPLCKHDDSTHTTKCLSCGHEIVVKMEPQQKGP